MPNSTLHSFIQALNHNSKNPKLHTNLNKDTAIIHTDITTTKEAITLLLTSKLDYIIFHPNSVISALPYMDKLAKQLKVPLDEINQLNNPIIKTSMVNIYCVAYGSNTGAKKNTLAMFIKENILCH